MTTGSPADAPTDPGDASSLLATLASRVRDLRRQHGWTREQLARRSGLSVRFLARVEAGEGNISVLRLEALASALATRADALLVPSESDSSAIVLVGLRGAGKSTVGPLLASRLGIGFVEVDRLITEASGLPLDQLFEIHGEGYYRRLERETLDRVLEERRPVVLAAAGGVVTDGGTWEMLCHRATVVWLRALPEDHWNRVVDQGDRRPMADNPRAMDELREILRDRETAYGRARWTIDTSGRTPEDVVEEIERRVRGSEDRS